MRTYVRGPDGTVGVWFLSLDAARLAPVVVARRHFHLPYYWSSMSLEVNGPGGVLPVEAALARSGRGHLPGGGRGGCRPTNPPS